MYVSERDIEAVKQHFKGFEHVATLSDVADMLGCDLRDAGLIVTRIAERNGWNE